MQRIISPKRHMSNNEHPLARSLRRLQLTNKPSKLAIRIILHRSFVKPEVLFVVEVCVDGDDFEVQIWELVGVGAVLIGLG